MGTGYSKFLVRRGQGDQKAKEVTEAGVKVMCVEGPGEGRVGGEWPLGAGEVNRRASPRACRRNTAQQSL